MHLQPRQQIRMVGGALLGLIVLCAGLGVFLDQTNNASRIRAAKTLWHDHALPHYRLIVQTDPACVLSIEVRSEAVTQIDHQDSCLHPARTVTDLFALIDRGQLSEPCFFAGCACRMNVMTYATYDPHYGYPRTISMRNERVANWWMAGFWKYVVNYGHLPGCALATETTVIQSIALTPLE
jgi:hypothetical protein